MVHMRAAIVPGGILWIGRHPGLIRSLAETIKPARLGWAKL
jgi:hypothetical protein